MKKQARSATDLPSTPFFLDEDYEAFKEEQDRHHHHHHQQPSSAGEGEGLIEEEDVEQEDLEDLECASQAQEWCDKQEASEALRSLTEVAKIDLLRLPRPNFPLLVIDMDRTLLDGTPLDPPMVLRPYAHRFLQVMHKYFDLCLWSKTAPEWLWRKMDETGLSAMPFVCALDRSHMLRCDVNKEAESATEEGHNQTQTTGAAAGGGGGREIEEEQVVTLPYLIKPLQLLWARFPQYWRRENTLMIDDKGISSVLSKRNALRVRPFIRGRGQDWNDNELFRLSRYLIVVGRAYHEEGKSLMAGSWEHGSWRQQVKEAEAELELRKRRKEEGGGRVGGGGEGGE